MKIGVLKERKRDERRVALRPDQAAELSARGHEVMVEPGAGRNAGFQDQQYAAHATLRPRAQIYAECSLLLKVKCPLKEEFQFLRPHQTMFTYLHFDENIPPQDIRQIVDTGLTGIAYEWVEKEGRYPLLQPMSELTGAVYARKAMDLLMEHAGYLGGGYFSNVPAARAMVIGGGHIGANAVHVFFRNNLKVTIVDKHPETLDERMTRYVPEPLWNEARAELCVLKFSEDAPESSVRAISQRLPDMDILINAAVRRPTLPKHRCEFLVDRAGVRSMPNDSVVCDATACDKDFIETAVSSDSLTHYDVIEGVVHYNCDHIPSLVPRTATQMLTEVTFPYVVKLASGTEEALRKDTALAKGVMCYQKHLIHEYTATKKQMVWTRLSDFI